MQQLTAFVRARLAELERACLPGRLCTRHSELARLAREMVHVHQPIAGADGEIMCARCWETPPCLEARIVAGVWRSHPDHDPRWAVDVAVHP